MMMIPMVVTGIDKLTFIDHLKDIEKEAVGQLNQKSLDKNCYDFHYFGFAKDLGSEKALEAFLSPKKNPNTKKNFGKTKNHPTSVVKEHVMSWHAFLNHQHLFLLLLVSIPSAMHFKFYFQIKWFN